MTMCAEGDISGIVALFKNLSSGDEMDDDEEDDENEAGSMTPNEIVRWQDPLDGGKTGLHVALEKGQEEVVWLLLWLASGLETDVFPEVVRESAKTMEADRDLTGVGQDIRGLVDEAGRTSEDVAREMGSTWASLAGSGILG